ncbi:MAG: AbrB/MazE/SpoVT family DNA-binding domain-containing protein [Thaumarchaeota archaeon]|nr:AbrB/MazE/SpoVT family DNA-binding domain-containing protein [Nitrososphaerota archaeon]
MEFTFKSAVMKVGNSLVVNLPKPVVEVFSIDKGDSLNLLVTEKGIYIPLTAKKEPKHKEAEELLKRVERSR